MKTKLEARIAEQTGLAFCYVPGKTMWELVEYLAMHRTQVYYGYSKEGFTVTFLRLGREAAQELLNGWTESWMTDNAYAEAQFYGKEVYGLAG
jgi:hypothetical protein